MIRKGILKAFDSDTYKASVQVIGSLSVWLDNVTVSAALNRADMVAGRPVVLLSLDPSNPDDCILVGLWGVPQEPPPPGAHGSTHENGGSDEISIAGLAGEPAELTSHKGDASAHHTKYTDAEARAACASHKILAFIGL